MFGNRRASSGCLEEGTAVNVIHCLLQEREPGKVQRSVGLQQEAKEAGLSDVWDVIPQPGKDSQRWNVLGHSSDQGV